jgi:hypothetical protein
MIGEKEVFGNNESKLVDSENISEINVVKVFDDSVSEQLETTINLISNNDNTYKVNIEH